MDPNHPSLRHRIMNEASHVMHSIFGNSQAIIHHFSEQASRDFWRAGFWGGAAAAAVGAIAALIFSGPVALVAGLSFLGGGLFAGSVASAFTSGVGIGTAQGYQVGRIASDPNAQIAIMNTLGTRQMSHEAQLVAEKDIQGKPEGRDVHGNKPDKEKDQDVHGNPRQEGVRDATVMGQVQSVLAAHRS